MAQLVFQSKDWEVQINENTTHLQLPTAVWGCDTRDDKPVNKVGTVRDKPRAFLLLDFCLNSGRYLGYQSTSGNRLMQFHQLPETLQTLIKKNAEKKYSDKLVDYFVLTQNKYDEIFWLMYRTQHRDENGKPISSNQATRFIHYLNEFSLINIKDCFEPKSKTSRCIIAGFPEDLFSIKYPNFMRNYFEL